LRRHLCGSSSRRRRRPPPARAVPCRHLPSIVAISATRRTSRGGRRAVRLQLTVRKFVCRKATCTRRIFTERLPGLVVPSARKTQRFITALRAIGMAVGGQAGARLAARLGVPASAATLFRLVRGRRSRPRQPSPTFLELPCHPIGGAAFFLVRVGETDTTHSAPGDHCSSSRGEA
jgi:hypothetical protein